jgi:3-hydroxyacyl-CoA dehydrogenase
MNRVVWFSRIPPFGIIIVSNPPVNALNPAVVEGIRKSLQEAEREDSVKAIILTATGGTFIAGADENEFRLDDANRKRHESLLHPLLHAIEDCRKPVVCAIHGTTLGGGFEIAMACHYRVAAESAQVGQPEIKLGLIPSAGGTQRLPRLAGVAKAAAMCSEGNAIGAYEAFRAGIVDRVIDGALLPGALDFARNALAEGYPLRKTRDFAERLGDEEANAAVLNAARDRARKRYRGQLAPLKAIDAVEAATRLPFEEGCRRENDLFNECLASDQSKALIHVFFAEQEISKIPGISDSGPLIHVQKSAVVGAGSMGTGIAMAYADAGIPVLLMDASRELLDKGFERIRSNYEISLKKGRLEQESVNRRLGLIRPVLGYDGFSEADVVVEAVYEDLQLKRQIFRDLSLACKPEAILATNTSTLDIDQIASAASDPSRVVGHHFFAPANVMQLIEIVQGRATSGNVIASSVALAMRLKKTPVVVGNCRGFAGNRMYYSYQREAQFLVEEGAEVQQVDRALHDFGMAMGPFATRDLSGLDTAWRVQKEYAAIEPEGARLPLVLDRLYKMGRFGQKTGAGWYRYQPGEREPLPDPEVQEIIRQCSGEAGIKRRPISSIEILERTLYAVINEGARILEEGIVQKAVALDIIFITGYGFPAYRGGPMWFADNVGLKAVCDRLDDFQSRFGRPWAPAPLLKRLAEEGRSFADHDKKC